MQAEQQLPGQWPASPDPKDYTLPAPSGNVMTSAGPNTSPLHLDGAHDPSDFYRPFAANGTPRTGSPSHSTPTSASANDSHQACLIPANHSFSHSPPQHQPQSTSGPPTSQQHTLNTAKSNPSLPSRQSGSVKDIARRFNQLPAIRIPPTSTAATRIAEERYRTRQPGANASNVQRSPVSGNGMAKLQRKRPGQLRSPTKSSKGSPATSFDTNNSSFSSNATIATTRSQPPAAFSPKNVGKQDYSRSRAILFGEVTSDGHWSGNFDPGYGISDFAPPPTVAPPRRGSEGSVLPAHGRSQSHDQVRSPPTLTLPTSTLHHKRSRSEMDVVRPPQQAPSKPNLNTSHILPLYPTPPNSGTRHSYRKASPSSRVPATSNFRRPSTTSESSASNASNSRSASAMSIHGRGGDRLSKSPTRRALASVGQESVSLQNRRYNPTPLAIPKTNQTLNAKIVLPPPKISPQLRSSRPRQPVSAATTASSRARAAESRFQNPNTTPMDARKPSEQWLGRQYKQEKENKRRKDPILTKVNLAERRAKIHKAISQHLLEEKSRDSPEKKRPQLEEDARAETEAEGKYGVKSQENRNEVDQHQADILDRETERELTDTGRGPQHPGSERGLNVDTKNVSSLENRESESGTAVTEFEMIESPVLGVHLQQMQERQERRSSPLTDLPTLLSSATYEPPAAPQTMAAPPPALEEVNSPSILESAMRMRQRSDSSASLTATDFEESPLARDSPSDIEDRWGLGNEMSEAFGDQGSINIMLDNEPTVKHILQPQSHQPGQPWIHVDVRQSIATSFESDGDHTRLDDLDHDNGQEYHDEADRSNGFTDSPLETAYRPFANDEMADTPRRSEFREDTLKPATFQPQAALATEIDSRTSEKVESGLIDQVRNRYQSTGGLTPEVLQEMQERMVEMSPDVSKNGFSDAAMIQNLLHGILQGKEQEEQQVRKQTPVPAEQPAMLQSSTYQMPDLTPDSPPNAAEMIGTAVIYSAEPDPPADDLETQIQRADEAWEREQRGEWTVAGAEDDEKRPTPPPKDEGYSPISSLGPNSATFAPNLSNGLRLSGTHMDLPPIQISGEPLGFHLSPEKRAISSAPPAPAYAPPPPPPPTMRGPPPDIPDVPLIPASFAERGSGEHSPRIRKALYGPSSNSPRPSLDSQRRLPPAIPNPNSMSNFADAQRLPSVDQSSIGTSPGPEHKRLVKRRHVVKELLDTEHAFNQDMKILEDIYKATVSELISAEDKKILFGNSDEIERFSLQFYDQLRKAVSSVYSPPRKWSSKRGSFSTTQSDGTGPTSIGQEPVDDEKDRKTSVGVVFQANIERLEQVYGTYLKNHDAANQRLSALKGQTTVKCWLDECHANASDITAAWDLDSLLVKPTQRISKYPLMLNELLRVTPEDHPDYPALKQSAEKSIDIMRSINEAKKRADLVDQIVNRKRKDSDVRSGIAKAFGRRTEKIKERIGAADAFQDPEFDDLAQKFGGHYIRLQICMRDCQDYLHRTDMALEQFNRFAAALEAYMEVQPSSLPEVESKWRKYLRVIKDLTAIALPEHKAAVSERVITPMLQAIRLHEGPQNAINKRKKRIVDFAKCKSMERRGEKPDKKTLEASEMYEALNEQMKIDLPKLYSLTADFIQACLRCFVDVQREWHHTWERKLATVVDDERLPKHPEEIARLFAADFDLTDASVKALGICNGAVLHESSNFLSPQSTFVGDLESSSGKVPSTRNSSKRTSSISSDQTAPLPRPDFRSDYTKRNSGNFGNHSPAGLGMMSQSPAGARLRSNSSMSNRSTPTATRISLTGANQPWATVPYTTHSYFPPSYTPTSRPSTGTVRANEQQAYIPPARTSAESGRSPRIPSGGSYFTADPEAPSNQRASLVFNSALPPDTPDETAQRSPKFAPPDVKVMFVVASLFEFNIDRERQEGGYPYLTYVAGEIFNVVAQKGELWLGRNQDDKSGTLGWIWEQHFAILAQETG